MSELSFILGNENGNILPPGEDGNLAIQIKPARPFCLYARYVVRNQTRFGEYFQFTGDFEVPPSKHVCLA